MNDSRTSKQEVCKHWTVVSGGRSTYHATSAQYPPQCPYCEIERLTRELRMERDTNEAHRKARTTLEQALRNIANVRVGDQLIMRPDLYAKAQLDAAPPAETKAEHQT